MKTIEKCNGFCRDLKAQQIPMKQNYVRNPGFKELLAGFKLKPGFKQKPSLLFNKGGFGFKTILIGGGLLGS